MPKNETDLPPTLERSDEHAQRTWQKTHDSRLTLQDLARRLDVEGRSTMNKDELVEAVDKANQRTTARARRS